MGFYVGVVLWPLESSSERIHVLPLLSMTDTGAELPMGASLRKPDIPGIQHLKLPLTFSYRYYCPVKEALVTLGLCLSLSGAQQRLRLFVQSRSYAGLLLRNLI